MMVRRLALGLLLFGVCLPNNGRAQSTDSERKAFARVKASAEKGNAEAQLQLGELYAEGDGTKKDLEKALKWHRKAAEQGLARAQYRLALDYANGEGVKIDSRESAHWFQKAATQGFAEAQYEFALCLISGRGVVESGVEGIKWLRKAVDQGFTLAEYQIGHCYLEGTGVPKDIEEGIKWIRGAAEKGVPSAQVELGVCYDKGEGVPRDGIQAYKWFALAAADDDEHSLDIKVRLAKLESKLSKEEVAEAQRLAQQFKASQTSAPPPSGTQVAPSKSSERSAADPARTGHVEVKADLGECELYVDGSFIGNPPATLQLPEGAHVIEIRKAGFKQYKRELKVLAGSDLNITARLEKQ